jgi:uncharacterized protein YbjT (DUF2867 family)
MFAITGITGQVGGKLANALLREGHGVRAVLRDESKTTPWQQRGCDIAIAEMDDAAALQRAFEGVEGVFIVLPLIFDPSPGFTEARTYIAAIRQALDRAAPPRVVCLSTIGAQVERESLLTQLRMLEQALGTLPIPIAFLRAAWFMENFAADVGNARQDGTMQSFLQPIDKAVSMVATIDIAEVASSLLQQTWEGLHVVELEGPSSVSPENAAQWIGEALQRDVALTAVPRDKWDALFRAQGMKYPLPRIQMLDGFNAGWIEFETPKKSRSIGSTSLGSILKSLAMPSV